MKLTLIKCKDGIVCPEATAKRVEYKVKSIDKYLIIQDIMITCFYDDSIRSKIVWIGKADSVERIPNTWVRKWKKVFGNYIKKTSRGSYEINIPDEDLEVLE